MNTKNRHLKHDEIERRLRDGLTDTAIAAELHCDRRAAAAIRALIGLPPMTNATTKGDKLDRYSTEPDADGHVLWTGRRSRNGTPHIRHCGKEIPAAHVAFERRTGRKPVGICRASCADDEGNSLYCLAPDHVQDDIERRRDRMTERAMLGLPPQPWQTCDTCDGEWELVGRVEPDLTVYCLHCNTVRAQRSRAARKAAVTEELTA
ncbi:HNH endonuclease [Streptomyces phage Mischief19]|nr:HNH endonuclease [Streptomyces phage Mischief19]